MKIWWEIVLLATFALGACAAPGPFDRVETSSSVPYEKSIFVMRHLQKAQGEDPPLSSEGAAAAERLAIMLADKDIFAIYATPTRRAMETAAPLARKTGIVVREYDPRSPDSLVVSITASQGSALVVGHSNTVPDLVRRLGGYPPPRLTEQDYGTVFIINATGDTHELRVD